MRIIIIIATLFITTLSAHAEDGSRLWMRWEESGTAIVNGPDGVAKDELQRYFTGREVTLFVDPDFPDSEGYSISKAVDGAITITAQTATGLLHGAYAALRGDRDVTSRPFFPIRIMNHWDNIDGSVERGYAGKSIFKWDEIDEKRGTMSSDLRLRLTQYSRAEASLGLNGVVLNNVNAQPQVLTSAYIKKMKVIADIMRPYGLHVYLSVNFASPMLIGGLTTADPLNDDVARWWQKKAKEIYKAVPDFGGFLVKANSEGQPGPGDYGRSHTDGANMLADALAPYGGTVIWRSFVYGANHKGEDRVMQAVSEFLPCDGLFRENVLLQSKNGPLDFQPREPYAPIFDRMQNTPQIAELQVTMEYLGQGNHVVFLAPMWKEFFSFVRPDRLKGIAGVSNVGDAVNWCGHDLLQANWYAFGRLAWDPTLSARDIAREWLQLTFGQGDNESLTTMMLRSREACVNYMMPLGLHHLFMFDHHYGPQPDGFRADYPLEWCPVYYHKADSIGVGFNRSSSGTNAVAQYDLPWRTLYDDPRTCPLEYLLWFHHVAWDAPLTTGRTLWQELCWRYRMGVDEVENIKIKYKSAAPLIDSERHEAVSRKLDIMQADARLWRQTCLEYFQRFSKMEIE